MVSLADAATSQSPGSASISASSSRIHRSIGHSMRTFRSSFYHADRSCSFSGMHSALSENLSDSVVDFHLRELAGEFTVSKPPDSVKAADLLDISADFSDFHSFGSDISGELERLALLPQTPSSGNNRQYSRSGEVVRADASDLAEVAAEGIESEVRMCIGTLESSLSIEAKRSAAGKLRLLAKNRSDFRTLIGSSGAIPALVSLLRSTDPLMQENAVTALLNLSLEESNKAPITTAGAIKPLVYALKTGTSVTKQNAACALLNLSMIEENRTTIGACGAIPPLVSLLIHGSSRGKKDALTTLYKLCTTRQNKERAVRAGAVVPLLGMIMEPGAGVAEKAMVVLSSLVGIAEGREAVVDEGGIPVLVEAIEDGTAKGKEFAVMTLLQLCSESARNRGLLVREGAIPPLVALSQSGSARAKHKAETLLAYLREQRQECAQAYVYE